MTDNGPERDKAIENELRIIQGMMRGKRPGDISSSQLYDPSEIDIGNCIKKIQLVMLEEVNQEHGDKCPGQKITELGPRLQTLSVLLGKFLFEMLKFHHQYHSWPKLIKCERELAIELRKWEETGLLYKEQMLGVPWIQSELDLGRQGFVFAMPSETPPMEPHGIM